MASEQAGDRKQPMHSDHRARMRERVEKYGLDSLAEHEALEYILFFAIPRQDTNPIAHRLIEHFGSFANVLDASEEELRTVQGIGMSAAHFLHSLREIERYDMLSRSGPHTRLADTRQLTEYLMPLFHGVKQEKLAMLALDDRRRLLRMIWLESGSAGSLDISVRKIAGAAVASGAACVVLAHNHPDGVSLPSREDLLSTQAVMQALALLDIQLLDHLILTQTEWLSLRDSGRMPPCGMRGPGR